MRLLSTESVGENVRLGLEFSDEMNCSSITKSLSVYSTARDGQAAHLDADSVSCGLIANIENPVWPGTASSVYNYSIVLSNVHHGTHEIVVNNPTTADLKRQTNVC